MINKISLIKKNLFITIWLSWKKKNVRNSSQFSEVKGNGLSSLPTSNFTFRNTEQILWEVAECLAQVLASWFQDAVLTPHHLQKPWYACRSKGTAPFNTACRGQLVRKTDVWPVQLKRMGSKKYKNLIRKVILQSRLLWSLHLSLLKRSSYTENQDTTREKQQLQPISCQCWNRKSLAAFTLHTWDWVRSFIEPCLTHFRSMMFSCASDPQGIAKKWIQKALLFFFSVLLALNGLFWALLFSW